VLAVIRVTASAGGRAAGDTTRGRGHHRAAEAVRARINWEYRSAQIVRYETSS